MAQGKPSKAKSKGVKRGRTTPPADEPIKRSRHSARQAQMATGPRRRGINYRRLSVPSLLNIVRFYNPNGDYDDADKEELVEECKASGEEVRIQERPIIAKFLYHARLKADEARAGPVAMYSR